MSPACAAAMLALVVAGDPGGAFPISFGLQRGDPGALLVVIGLMATLHRMMAAPALAGPWRWVLAQMLILVAAIPWTDPRSGWHDLVFFALIVSASSWAITAAWRDGISMAALSAGAIAIMIGIRHLSIYRLEGVFFLALLVVAHRATTSISRTRPCHRP